MVLLVSSGGDRVGAHGRAGGVVVHVAMLCKQALLVNGPLVLRTLLEVGWALRDLVAVTAPPGYGYVHSPCNGVTVAGFVVPEGEGDQASREMREMNER